MAIQRTTAALLGSRECDRMYRLKNGTASTAWKSGRLPGKKRGRTIFVSAKRAKEIWGVES